MIPVRPSLATVLLLSGFVPSHCQVQCDKKVVPDDFKVFARYFPGYSSWKAWKTTITANGDVTQDVFNDKTLEWDRKCLRPLTPQALADLAMRVKKSDYFRLQKQYDHPVTDNPTLVVVVTMDGRSKEVDVYAPDHQKDKAEVKRFLTVWAEVLKKVPSPNPEQKPEMY